MPVTIRQQRDVPGPPIGAGAVAAFVAAPLPGSVLVALFNAPAATGLWVGGAAGWARISPNPIDSGSGGGHSAGLEAWWKRSAGAADQSSTWTLLSSMTTVYLFELAGAGAIVDISTMQNQGANVGGILTSPVQVATPGGLGGLAIGWMGHDGGTHFDAGNNPNGDYLAAAAAGWTIDLNLNVSGSSLLGHQAYLGSGPAMSWGWRDHNAGNGNYGGILFRVDELASAAFPGEPGGGMW